MRFEVTGDDRIGAESFRELAQTLLAVFRRFVQLGSLAQYPAGRDADGRHRAEDFEGPVGKGGRYRDGHRRTPLGKRPISSNGSSKVSATANQRSISARSAGLSALAWNV